MMLPHNRCDAACLCFLARHEDLTPANLVCRHDSFVLELYLFLLLLCGGVTIYCRDVVFYAVQHRKWGLNRMARASDAAPEETDWGRAEGPMHA